MAMNDRISSTVTTRQNLNSMASEFIITTIVKDIDSLTDQEKASIFRDVAKDQIKALANEWVEQNKGEILKHLNPQAVANLALADAARGVRETIIDPPKKKKDK